MTTKWSEKKNMFRSHEIYCMYLGNGYLWLDTLRQRQNGSHFSDDIFKCIFLNENVWVLINMAILYNVYPIKYVQVTLYLLWFIYVVPYWIHGIYSACIYHLQSKIISDIIQCHQLQIFVVFLRVFISILPSMKWKHQSEDIFLLATPEVVILINSSGAVSIHSVKYFLHCTTSFRNVSSTVNKMRNVIHFWKKKKYLIV